MDEIVKQLLEHAFESSPITVILLLVLFSPLTTAMALYVAWRANKERLEWQERFIQNSESMERTNDAWLDLIGSGDWRRANRRGGVHPFKGPEG